jgi:hypothetical protein
MRKNLFITLAVITGMAISMSACGRLGSDLDTLWEKAVNDAPNDFDDPNIPDSAYARGATGPGGGKVFYYNAKGFTMTDNKQVCHYLEAAPDDMATTLAWASSGYTYTNISGIGLGIGTGRKNTALILGVDGNAPAAKACKEYRGGGKTDWFLPSKDELNQLYLSKDHIGNMGTNWHWSSSQDKDYSAWSQAGNVSKSSTYHVRAVRCF